MFWKNLKFLLIALVILGLFGPAQLSAEVTLQENLTYGKAS